MHQKLVVLCMVVFACSTVMGCASKYGARQTAVAYYPACYKPIQDLRASEQSTVKGTAGGALLGALGGALVGFLSSGDSKGALVGAGVGAVAGGVIGNRLADAQQTEDDNKRMAMYLNELNGDISNLDIVKASARMSLQCYDKQFTALMAAYKRKEINNTELHNRYAEIRSGTQEAESILGEVVNTAREREKEYVAALTQERQAVAASTNPVKQTNQPKQTKPKQVSKPTQAALRKAEERSKAYSQSVAELDKERAQAAARTAARDAQIEAAVRG